VNKWYTNLTVASNCYYNEARTETAAHSHELCHMCAIGGKATVSTSEEDDDQSQPDDSSEEVSDDDTEIYHSSQSSLGLDTEVNVPKKMPVQAKKTHPCSYCGKLFDTQSHRNIHQHRLHGGTKRYECTTCFKLFHEPYELKIHNRTHSDARPFKCSQCDKQLKTSLARKKHEMIVHAGISPHVCSVCGKATPSVGAL